MKTGSRWYSPRLEQEISLVRWGHWGQPVLIFPTAGGDGEEIERMHMIGALGDLINQGRIKVYSCDSVAGQTLTRRDRTPAEFAREQDRFDRFIAQELVPWIRKDCESPDIEIITAGASIGAFNALALVCRYPDLFRAAVCMSGTYDVQRFIGGFTDDLYFASPVHFLPDLGGPVLDALRQRFVVLASGSGKWEDVGEAWRVAVDTGLVDVVDEEAGTVAAGADLDLLTSGTPQDVLAVWLAALETVREAKVTVLNEGRIMDEGDLDDLKQNKEVIEAYLGR